jgi:hypothetical protein
VFSHDLVGRKEPQNGYLRETIEKELFSASLLKPTLGFFRMHGPAPYKRQPDVRIKEIQRIDRFVRWSALPLDLQKR